MRSFLLITLALFNEVLCFSFDFYTVQPIPDFSEEELKVLKTFQIEFKELNERTVVSKHNSQVLKLIDLNGNDWRLKLAGTLAKTEANHHDFFNGLFRKNTIRTGFGFVQFEYHSNGIIALRRNIKDMLNGGSSRAYFKHKIKEERWDKKGNYKGKKTYQESGSMCCFLGSTTILMNDGTDKRICDLKVNDTIQGLDLTDDSLVPAVVEEMTVVKHNNLVQINFTDFSIIVTTDHPLVTAGGEWGAVDPERAGQYIESEVVPIKKGTQIKVYQNGDMINATLQSIEPYRGSYTTYTINKLDNATVYFANGIAVGTEPLTDKSTGVLYLIGD